MCSIRLIFSIADLQSEQEAEFEEGEEPAEEGAEDAEAPLHSYPIRCSFSFTKVRCAVQLTTSSDPHSLVQCHRDPPPAL